MSVFLSLLRRKPSTLEYFGLPGSALSSVSEPQNWKAFGSIEVVAAGISIFVSF